MKLGIYPNMPWNEYRELPYPSPSVLKHALRGSSNSLSMKRLKRALEGECEPDPKNTIVGNIVHAIIGGEFDERIAVMPSFELDDENLTSGTAIIRERPKTMFKKDGSYTVVGNRWNGLLKVYNLPEDHNEPIEIGRSNRKKTTSKGTDYYQKKKEEFEKANADKEIATKDELSTAQKTVKAIRYNLEATEFIKSAAREVSVIGEIEGVVCKTRIDLLDFRVGEGLRAGDIKTTNDIEPDAFYRTCKRLKYFFQFAMHELLLANCGEDSVQIQDYDVIAAETQDDFDVGVINILPLHILDSWEDKVRSVVESYRLANVSGNWPGLYPTSSPIRVPNWDMEVEEVFEG